MATYIDDSGNLVDSNAPVSYDDQVAMLLSWGTPPDQIQGLIGTRESVAEGQKAQAQEIYERTGEAPSYSESVGFTPGAPAWLNPQDYTSSGYAAPYTQAEITGQVDPSNFRIMNGQLYASAKGAGDLSGGEYLIDPNTGRFKLDASGKPFGVTYAKPNNFDDWLTTPAGGLAVLSLPALAAAGAAAAGAYGAAGAGAGAAGAGTGTAGLTTAEILASGGFIPTAGSSFAIAPGAAYTAAGLGAGAAGQALPYTTAFDAANLYGQGLSQAAIEQNLAMTGIDPFLAADAASLASQGLSDAAIAQNLSYGYSPAELSGTGIESMALSSGGTGIDNLLSSLGSALKTPLGQLGVRGGLGLLSSAGQQAQVPQVAGGSGTYAPKGQVDYTPILNLLAPKQIARNTNSLLG
jgi:hypothetical protein